GGGAGGGAKGGRGVPTIYDRPVADFCRPVGGGDPKRSTVRKRGDPHARTGKVARGPAHHTGPLGTNTETRLTRSADRRYRARNQEPAQFRQQLLGGLHRIDRRITGCPERANDRPKSAC